MALKLGNTDINKLALGSTEINRAYLGSTEVFSVSSYFLRMAKNSLDGLEVDTIPTWTNRSDVKLMIDCKIDTSETYSLFSRGRFNDATTGLIVCSRSGSLPNQLQINITGLSNSNSETIAVTFDNTQRNIIEVDNLEVKLNGNLVSTFTETQIDIPSSRPMHFAEASYFNNGSNVDIYKCSVNNSEFRFPEGSGNRTFANDGLGATIYTSDAGGINYINNFIWQPL